MAWLSNNGFSPTDSLHADDINNLANDIRVWGGNVNGGGYHLSNVIIDNYFPGAGAPLLSPIHVIPTSTDYTSQLRLDSEATGNPARWILIKDASTESGANAGSNFQLVRCNDDGSTIDAPISIVRSTGVITMGAQQWNGNVNGGGFTLSNVVLPGVFTDPTTTKGDLIVHGATTTRLPVGTDGMVLQCDSTQTVGLKWALSPAVQTSFQILTPAGSGLSGGGAMTGSSLSLAADVLTVFGRKGDVVLTAADITGATGVINTRQVLAGAGMSGGGPLTADVTLNANVLSVNGHTGAVVLVQQDITNSGGVPSSRQILPGAGMSGGGTLASDITLNALVTSVFGRTGAVVLTAADISGATGVLTTRQINTATGSGLAGGGPLSADLSLSVVADTTTQRTVFMSNGSVVGNPRSYMNFKPGPNANVRVTLSDDTANNKMDVAIDATGTTGIWHNGVLIANRPAINLIDGSNVTITPTDNSTANSGNGWVDITISSTGGGGGGGGSQSPWTGPIDAANNSLSNVALIGVNRPADTLPVGPSTARIEVQTNSTEAGIRVAQATAAQVAIIEADNDNATAKVSLRAWGSQYGGSLQSTGGLNAGAGPMTFAIAAAEAMRIGTSKNVLIGTSADDGTHLLQVNGMIKSLSGGIVFPDGSVQTSAAAAGFGDPTTTKGDMIVHSSTGTTRLPVGATNGMVLIADSTSTYGVSWSTSAGQTPWTQNIDAAGFYLKNAKAIGIGMVPTYAVDIYANPGPAVVRAASDGNVAGQYAMFLGYSYSGSSANSGVIVQGASARGMQASPAASAAGDALLQLAGFGYTGSAFVQGAGIQMITGSLFSTSNAQTYISFSTTASGSVTVTERMRILGNGNVGIGTSSPQQLLHINNTASSANALIQFNTGSVTSPAYVGLDGNSYLAIQNTGALPIRFNTNNTDRMVITSAGNVGIATTSPDSTLMVCLDSPASGGGTSVHLAQPNGSWGTVAAFNSYRFISTSSGATDGTYKTFQVSGGGVAIGYSNTPVYGSGDALYVNGSVGIGTAAPQATLHVNRAAAGGYGFILSSSSPVHTYGMGVENGTGAFLFDDVTNGVRRITVTSGGGVVITGTLTVGSASMSWSSGLFNVAGGRSYIYANSEPYAFGLAYAPSSTGGTYIGTNASSQFQVSNSGGSAILQIDQNGVGAFASSLTINGQLNINAGSGPATINDLGVSINCQASGGRLYELLSSGGGTGLGVGNFSIFDGSAGSPRISVTPGGFVGLNVINPASQLTIIPFNNPSSFSALQMAIGENSNNTGYRLYLGFIDNGGYWAGAVNAIAGGGGTHLYVNPAGGAVRVGSSAVPGYNLDINGDCNVTGVYRVNGTPLSTGISGVNCYVGGINQGNNPGVGMANGSGITISYGNVGSGSTAYGQWTITNASPSDERLKRNVRPLEGGLSVINQMHLIEAEWNGLAQTKEGDRVVGVMAQELQRILPGCVEAIRLKLRPEDEADSDILHVNTHELLMHLILAVQQLSSKLKIN